MRTCRTAAAERLELQPMNLANRVLVQALAALPEEVGDLTALQELYVNGNSKFNSLPSTVGRLKQLRELALRGCPKLKSLPKSVEDCEGLKELDMRTGGKKEVCKVPAEITEKLESQKCKVRGAVVKKAKGKKGKKK